jgi:uncharacterized protein YdiU (UPF0061 family)
MQIQKDKTARGMETTWQFWEGREDVPESHCLQVVSYAHNYGGHQFGYWAGQLGDGRAVCLGEIRGADER